MIKYSFVKMIAVIRKEIDRRENNGDINPEFIDTEVNFIRTYADKCHNGKEEDILFKGFKRNCLMNLKKY